MEYLNNNKIQQRLEKASSYQKKAETLLRRPTSSEIGNSLVTLVKDGDGVRQESTNTISQSSVIARNPGAIGSNSQGDVYNEWVIEDSVVAKNYGPETLNNLTTQFAPFRKSNTIKAIPITDEVLGELGVLSGHEVPIDVSWSDEPMIAKKGDYLTCQGYSISSHDMQSTYVLVPSMPSPNISRETLLAGLKKERVENPLTQIKFSN